MSMTGRSRDGAFRHTLQLPSPAGGDNGGGAGIMGATMVAALAARRLARWRCSRSRPVIAREPSGWRPIRPSKFFVSGILKRKRSDHKPISQVSDFAGFSGENGGAEPGPIRRRGAGRARPFTLCGSACVCGACSAVGGGDGKRHGYRTPPSSRPTVRPSSAATMARVLMSILQICPEGEFVVPPPIRPVGGSLAPATMARVLS
jgi:hypothetical protein